MRYAAIAVAVSALPLVAAPAAHAAFVGNGVTLQDQTGLQLQAVVPAVAAGGAAAGPVFWTASASLSVGAGGSASLQYTLDAPIPAAGEIAVAGGMRAQAQLTISKLQPSTAYTIRTPYGPVNTTTDAAGNVNIKLRTLCAGTCSLPAELAPLAGPFLRTAPAQLDPRKTQDIGTGKPATVVGSPIGVDEFAVQGPGAAGTAGDVVSTDQWSVTGTMAGPETPLAELDLAASFAASTVGDTQSQAVVVRNVSRVPFGVPGATFAGAAAADFLLGANGCTTVAGAGTCTVGITFAPTASGSRAATMHLAMPIGSPSAVQLHGSGVARAVAGQVAGPSARRFRGRVVSVNVRRHTIVVRTASGARVTIHTTGRTTFARTGLARIRTGATVDISATRSAGAWVATRVQVRR